MPEPMYSLSFRRMTVEKIPDPTPPAEIDTSRLQVPKDVRSRGSHSRFPRRGQSERTSRRSAPPAAASSQPGGA